MAVDVGKPFKAFIFDGESSREYGAYITGEAVYDAPERDVEMITIPNRNGAFTLDKGRFNNIEVKYSAGVYADTEEGFSKSISDLRNFLCSKKGYCKLTDEYNSDEYRMAVYKSGLDVTPANKKAGTFDIIFDCKPQRFLTSGDIPIDAESGEPVFNPTLFDSSPMLEAVGYGEISINGYKVTLNNEVFGEVELCARKRVNLDNGYALATVVTTFDPELVATGDVITLNQEGYSDLGTDYYGSVMSHAYFQHNGQYAMANPMQSARNLEFYDALKWASAPTRLDIDTLIKPVSFTVGTEASYTAEHVVQVPMVDGSDNVVETVRITLTFEISYDGNNTITVKRWLDKANDTLRLWSIATYDVESLAQSQIMANSTASVLGNPTYIDCDLGTAYKVANGEKTSLNAYIDLGSKLPVLSPKSNEISFDNTITSLKIKPRWWKV